MAISDGRKAHDHAVSALSNLLNESWSFDVLGEVRYELGQAYYLLQKNLKKGKCHCEHGLENMELFKKFIIYVNAAITEACLRPIPIVVEELQSYISSKKHSHRCISLALEKYSMTYDV